MNKSLVPILLTMTTLLTSAQMPPITNTPKPPVAKRVPKPQTVNGVDITDQYFWLRDKPNPEVAAYLDAENAYTDAVMKPTAALQKELYKEMLAHIKETDTNVPYREGDYFYYSRTEQGKQYPIFCRKARFAPMRPSRSSSIVNKLAEGEKFMNVGIYERERRRQLARLHHRQHRLPPVHAASQGSGDRRRLYPEKC